MGPSPSTRERPQSDCEDCASAVALVNQLALMLAHDCLLYEAEPHAGRLRAPFSASRTEVRHEGQSDNRDDPGQQAATSKDEPFISGYATIPRDANCSELKLGAGI